QQLEIGRRRQSCISWRNSLRGTCLFRIRGPIRCRRLFMIARFDDWLQRRPVYIVPQSHAQVRPVLDGDKQSLFSLSLRLGIRAPGEQVVLRSLTNGLLDAVADSVVVENRAAA